MKIRANKTKSGSCLNSKNRTKKADSTPHVLTQAEIERGRSRAYSYAM